MSTAKQYIRRSHVEPQLRFRYTLELSEQLGQRDYFKNENFEFLGENARLIS